MEHPFQLVETIKPSGKRFLLAACGASLICVNLSDGTVASRWGQELSKWPSEVDNLREDPSSDEPPNKKRKKNETEQQPTIISIMPTSDQAHAIVVTSEDKCVRVFTVSENGTLEQLSRRIMPKRPSAIALIDNDSIILCADKFGDVYTLPLLPTAEEDEAVKQAALTASKAYRPAASESTVHSKANLKSLESQKKRALESTDVKIRESLGFAHDLILGHISMLTDVIVAEAPSQREKENSRSYIITSDRDEHIRISRGPPQSYIIEGFCLGHTQFVSKLCLATPEILVSGGGDDDLFVWDWQKRQIMSKIPLKSVVAQATGRAESECQVAVSGMWLLKSPSRDEDKLLVACEGVATLFHCPIYSLVDGKVTLESMEMEGNLLDLTLLDDIIIISIDGVHRSGSVTEMETSKASRSRLQVVDLGIVTTDGYRGADLISKLGEANAWMTPEWQEKKLQNLIYPVEHLRKRKNEGDAEGEE